MERLCKEVFQKKKDAGEFYLEGGEEKFIQFGEGNFLRGFVDCFIDVMNEKAGFNSKVVVVQPLETGMADVINSQDGLYNLYLRGLSGGDKVNIRRTISSISRALNPYSNYDDYINLALDPGFKFIVSNTTEAGIEFDDSCKFDDKPPRSFPAKLTQLLFKRYEEGLDGFIILSCELIDNNGSELKKCVLDYCRLWELPRQFTDWILNENYFCNTLVDRIVTGYPKAEADKINRENGYEDRLINTAEPFGLWVIEGPEKLKDLIPFEKAGVPIIITDNHVPHKKKKVRILNGMQTAVTLTSFLGGFDIERDWMDDQVVYPFLKKLTYEEIIPSLDLPLKEITEFADDCMERISNPFIDHMLIDITLNSVSKWRARDLPSVIDYMNEFNELPQGLLLSFAALIHFYHGKYIDGKFVGSRGESHYPIRDSENVIEFFAQYSDREIDDEMIKAFAGREDFFGQNLNKIEGFVETVIAFSNEIREMGVISVMQRISQK